MKYVRKSRFLVTLLILVLLYGIILTRSKDGSGDAAPRTKEENEYDVIANEKQLETRKLERRNLVTVIKSKPTTSRTPDVIIIGVRKCGTGSLRDFLGQHPSLVCGEETHYYDNSPTLGVEYYKSLLRNGTVDQLIVDKTPAYFTSFPINLPEIMKRDCPGVKIILMLCDPTHRSLSDHTQRRLNPNRNLLQIGSTLDDYVSIHLSTAEKMFQAGRGDVENVLGQIQNKAHYTILLAGAYSVLLPRWTKAFSDDRFLMVDGEQFIQDPGLVIETIQKFLSIPVIIGKEDFVLNKSNGMKCLVRWWEDTYDTSKRYDEEFHDCTTSHKGRTRSRNSKYVLTDEMARKLDRFYKPSNLKLKQMIKKNWSWLN